MCHAPAELGAWEFALTRQRISSIEQGGGQVFGASCSQYLPVSLTRGVNEPGADQSTIPRIRWNGEPDSREYAAGTDEITHSTETTFGVDVMEHRARSNHIE
ncbi:MAG: hypothetical protein R2713_01620 [Ilumatobacteraceae bacterium]